MALDPAKLRAAFAERVRVEYSKRYPVSADLHQRGAPLFPNGVAQYGRMTQPFPPYFRAASGARVYSVDEDNLIDYWAGHFCMLLGQNPRVVIEALTEAARKYQFLQMGLHSELEADVAEAILAYTGDDSVLFSTSGALATMHAIMLASAATGREKILKIEGGWHGVQPWAMSGVRRGAQEDGQTYTECGGVPGWFDENVITIPFNDIEAVDRVFSRHGDTLAACILELVLGNAGMVMAVPAFVQHIRKSCTLHGVALILDELVTGFRVRPGGMQALFGVRGDISIYGKAISGGMPFACITGEDSLMGAARVDCHRRVLADAGTFTAHPGTLVAVKATLRHLSEVGQELFDGIMARAVRLRTAIDKAFSRRGVAVDITGVSTLPSLPAFPIATTRFVTDEVRFAAHPTCLVHWDSEVTDIGFRDEVSRLALLLKGLFSWQGLGVVTAAHSQEDIEVSIQAFESFASEIEGLFPKEVGR